MIRPTRPTLKFLFSDPSHMVALGFGSGLVPFAPGTFGTLFGWWSFDLLRSKIAPTAWPLLIAASFLIGVRVCDRTGRDLGVADHGAIVWDEIVAMWLVLCFVPGSLEWQASAFAAFRLFDIVKPPPIRWFDRHWKGGFGVMWDDLVAAFYALFAIALYVRWLA